jgi:hypothetical protein
VYWSACEGDASILLTAHSVRKFFVPPLLRAGDQDLERVLDPKALSTKSHHDNVVRSSFSPTEDLAVLRDESPARIDMKEKLYLEEFIGYSAIMRNKEGEFDFYGEHSAVKSLKGCAHYTYDAAYNKVF